jgi:hypothetical protein
LVRSEHPSERPFSKISDGAIRTSFQFAAQGVAQGIGIKKTMLCGAIDQSPTLQGHPQTRQMLQQWIDVLLGENVVAPSELPNIRSYLWVRLLLVVNLAVMNEFYCVCVVLGHGQTDKGFLRD